MTRSHKRLPPARLILTVLLGSTLMLAPFAAKADPVAPGVTVHPPAQDQTARAKPVDPDARVEADHTAFFAARLAALHAGLSLTHDQEALWPPVETALRDLAKTGRRSWREHRHDSDGLSSIDRLKQRGDRLVERGEAIGKLADATGPLLAALSIEQRSRLPILLRGVPARSVVARAFELRQDYSDMDGFGGRGEIGRSETDRSGPDHGYMNRGDSDRGGMDQRRDDRRGRLSDGDRDGDQASQDHDDHGGMAGQDDDAPALHRHHHHRSSDDDDGLDDIVFRG